MKLLAYPEDADEYICHMCDSVYSDTVEHYIMRCSGIRDMLNTFWDKVLDSLECRQEAKLLQKEEADILDILLTKDNNLVEYNSKISL